MVMLMVVISDDTPTQALSPLTVFFFYCPFPTFAVSVNTLHHHSTHLPVPVVFLPVSVWLTAVLPVFPHTVGESKYLYALSEMAEFYDLEKICDIWFPEQNFVG